MKPTDQKPVRVRLAPSPTGHLHVGTARTGLFNWLFARAQGGAFILRIEDTDKERSSRAFEEEILQGLHWLGLDWDEGPTHDGKEKGDHGPYRQSERAALHRTHLERLIEEGKAYFCYCTKEELEAERQSKITGGLPPTYGGLCRDHHVPPAGKQATSIRFKMPEAIVEFKDMVRGTVRFDAKLFGDVIIAKNLDAPLYNFAVVVDDFEMKISHVIRGEDHLSNTPKQILFAHALGFPIPEFGHLPLLLSKNREKLSKRFSEVSLLEYRTQGYLPEALMNFLALLGWHPSGNEEIFSPQELISKFNIKRVQKAGAVFDEEKLEWLNGQHIRRMSDEEVTNHLATFLDASHTPYPKELLAKVVSVERDRLKIFSHFFETAGFFFALPNYDAQLLAWQEMTPLAAKETLEALRETFAATDESMFEKESLKEILAPILERKGRGEVLWPLRVALSGRATSPDPLDIMSVLGKTESLHRIDLAIQKITESLSS